MLDSRKIRYLLAGGWNTLFGYTVGTGFYYLFSKHIHIIIVLILANFFTITMAFLTYKLFVFQTKGNWGMEYARSYLVYGTTALLSIIMLWLMVDFMAISFWIAQALMIVLTVIVSYNGHAHFTFSKTNKQHLS
jgi:putative flippase GtrA